MTGTTIDVEIGDTVVWVWDQVRHASRRSTFALPLLLGLRARLCAGKGYTWELLYRHHPILVALDSAA